MSAVTSLSFSGLRQCSGDRKPFANWTPSVASNLDPFRFHGGVSCRFDGVKASNSSSRLVVHCVSTASDVPTVSETKLNFLKAYKKPIPSIYNTVLQELMVQQHLIRCKRTYHYDPVFALGFVTVYDQLMEGYPSDEDRDAIFQAYIKALKEEPDQYRIDAKRLEEWGRAQNASSLVDFPSREGEVEGILNDIARRANSGSFSYSRFFAIGLFRLLELSNGTEPTILDKCKEFSLEVMDKLEAMEMHLCATLNISKKSVDRDLDIYRNLLAKLVQAKELLKEYVDREKKKREERQESQATNEAVKKFMGEPWYVGQ